MPPVLRSLPSTLFVPSPSLRLTLQLCPSLPEPSPFALARPRARANPKPGEPFLRFSVVWFEGEGSARGHASGRGLAWCFCCRCSCASPSHVGQCGGREKGTSPFSFEQDTPCLRRAMRHRRPGHRRHSHHAGYRPQEPEAVLYNT